jgi:hypothetical protein
MQQYSLVTRASPGGRAAKKYFQFSQIPPQGVREKLTEACKWQAYQKRWECADPKMATDIQRTLTRLGWTQVKNVLPAKTPLTVALVDTPCGDVLLQFNRAPDPPLVQDLQALAAAPNMDDKREWIVVAAKKTQARSLMRQHNVTTGNARKLKGITPGTATPATIVPPVNLKATMVVKEGAVTLRFEDGSVMPSASKLSELRGALAALGITVTDFASTTPAVETTN